MTAQVTLEVDRSIDVEHARERLVELNEKISRENATPELLEELGKAYDLYCDARLSDQTQGLKSDFLSWLKLILKKSRISASNKSEPK
jgi:hypothetical protein